MHQCTFLVAYAFHAFSCVVLSAQLRVAYEHQDVLRRAQSLAHAFEPLYQHGIPLLQPRPPAPHLVVRPCGGIALPSDFTFTGQAFTDGAMRGRAPKVARRAGWACVLVNEDGQVIAGLYGPCPDLFPTSLRAELWAVIQLLHLALPPITIWVDNKGVVDGWARGRVWCCSSARPAADLWLQFWRLVEDIGIEGIQICKCKGHATEADVQAGRSTAFLKRGNDHADHFAGRGADVAEDQVPSEEAHAAYLEAKRWYAWLSTLAMHWPADTQERPAERQAAKRACRKSPRPYALHARCPHELYESKGQLRCRKCPRFSGMLASNAARRAFASTACPGTVLEGAAASCVATRVRREETLRQGRSHTLYVTGQLVWCITCGCYGAQRLRNLKQPCCGPAAADARKSQLGRLRAGLHPLTKRPLGRPVRLQAAAMHAILVGNYGLISGARGSL